MPELVTEGFQYTHVMPEGKAVECVSDTDCPCQPLVLKKMVPIHVVVHFGRTPECECDGECECDTINEDS